MSTDWADTSRAVVVYGGTNGQHSTSGVVPHIHRIGPWGRANAHRDRDRDRGHLYARIRHPSPFLLTFPTPPMLSRTTNQSPVDDTTSLISSAVSTSPATPSGASGPAFKFQLGRAIPCGLTARRRTCSRSTMTSGSGKGTLSSATTFGWCGVGENVATRTRTTDSPSPPPPGLPALPSRDRTSVQVQGVSESSGSLSSPSSLSPRVRPAELPTSLPVDALYPEAIDSRFSARSIVPERSTVDPAEPGLPGETAVLDRRFAPVVWPPLALRVLIFFFPRLHTNLTSTGPSSGGVRDCRRSSDKPKLFMCPITLPSRPSFDPLSHLRTIQV